VNKVEKINDALTLLGEATVTQIALITGLSRYDVETVLRGLRNKSLIKSSGRTRRGKEIAYSHSTGFQRQIGEMDAVLRALHATDGAVTTQELSKLSGKSPRQMRSALEYLAHSGYIKMDRKARTTLWSRSLSVDLPVPNDPMVSGDMETKFLMAIPRWVPAKDLCTFFAR
jgi:predicted HTH transcriptional regulator